MKFHKEGYTTLALSILFVFVINALVHFFYSDNSILTWIVYILSFVLLVTVIQFFRNPIRKISPSEQKILCPADGKVVVIEETEETEYFKDRRLQVSIFMSPINVHSNRSPITGIVKFFKYHPGKYLMAWNPKSSTLNERTTIVVESSFGVEVLFRQIAGALARRIVWYVNEGKEVKQGEEFGFIKFGSRVDVFLPIGTKVNVKLGDKVKGGITILGEFDEEQPIN
ncbi:MULTISPECIES: phosphatidylserine decarboxylase family protein [Olivibacter]|jgi:phosphatidylserine decarboxylase|uniref:Phosphatidylserine decarboxylase proenzyme n=3 Tax=Sphingobacteriaceae TaxID=84566 RepID=F4CFB5_SPHS2|nr:MULTISPECIES: phosphatidylserine decarboxylase family protein [Olivibacter]MCL4641749.1 phosphatidylserine decarboxylase family protein [Olivibacter sp. UJ_SKK_5.1]MDM8177510.1 phosphatidylserine decarboxylase family protein [Olivibacter sp. 47]MDX3912228.1 phosphatidylserine decarboxylase family protein [Pseudosphingobacterium sp.]QEK99959.1 phosphatidylserine decarboxylase family protein [Olivibacter sp. LS-1]